jgi:hypothetical protein
VEGNSASHNASSSVDAVDQVFCVRVVTKELWPPRSPSLDPCDSFVGNAYRKTIENSPEFLE